MLALEMQPTHSFAEVFRAHAPFAWRCLRRLGVGAGDVDDVCQEVFLIVHKKLGTYDGRAPLRAWIYGICVRKASDHRKLARVQRERVMDEVPQTTSTHDGPDQALEGRRALERLDVALAALDDDKRAAFVLYEIEGLSLAEMSEALGAPVQTLHSRLSAARTHVVRALGSADQEGSDR